MRKLKNLMLALWFATLLGATAHAYPSTEAETLEEAEASVETDVQLRTEAATSQRQDMILSDAVSALRQTREAVQALEDQQVNEAMEALTIATGKLELLISRRPELALAPIAVSASRHDVYGSVGALEQALAEAEKALDRGDVQTARHLLNGLGSEVVISVTNLPLSTYPEAIKSVVPLIDDGHIEEAKRQLLAALNTLVVTDHVIALPRLRAELMLNIAEAIADQAERTEEQEKLLSESLQAVRQQLEMARLLGYGDDDQIDETRRALSRLEKSSDQKTLRAAFNDVRRGLANL